MSEKPILFNTEMVKAILEGRKTQTRRVMKRYIAPVLYDDDIPTPDRIRMNAAGTMSFDWSGRVIGGFDLKMPYKPGDVLWVRETWQHLSDFGGQLYVYRADYKDDEPLRLDGMYITWRPSIHMPREAARLFLRVTGVRCERLRDITARDAFYEGTGKLFLEDIAYGDKDYECDLDDEYGMAREQFAWLWESTLRKNDLNRYGWYANPWVWVIEFERMGSEVKA